MKILEDNAVPGRFKRYAIVRIFQFIVIIAFLCFVNWMTSPHHWWVLAGCGLGLLLNLVNKWYKLSGIN